MLSLPACLRENKKALQKEEIKQVLEKIPGFWLVFGVALIVRLVYLSFNIPDYWGDAFHNIYIAQATIANDWVYSDFSGREVVWMPFYRYLSAFFMLIFNRYDLFVPHLMNIVIGSFSAALVTSTVQKVADRKVAVLAGLCLAILPWHIAYSNINTPEVLSGFLILLSMHLWQSKKWVWLIPVVFIGVLTRNEVTLLLALFGVYLLVKKDWKPAVYMLLGAVGGLLVWGAWCYSQTGEFFWWISERSLGSTWNHLFQLQKGRELGKWYLPILSIIQAFPLLFIIAIAPSFFKKVFEENTQKVKTILVPVALVLVFDWIFIFIMQFRFYSYPEPKYFIITLPLACVILGCLYGTVSKEFFEKLSLKTVVFSIVILVLQTPVFYFLPFKDDPSRTVGLHLKESLEEEGNVWFDQTIAWYYSEIDFERIHSSYTIASRFERYEEGFEEKLRVKLDELDIRYVMSEPSSFTYVFNIWPEMMDGEVFEWKGLVFTPIYRYQKPELSNSIPDRIKDGIIPDNHVAIFWSIERVEG